MKRPLFCFYLLLPLALLAQPQPFAPIGAKWYVDIRSQTFPYDPLQDYRLIQSTGDTIIGGLTLRQVGPFLLHQDSGRVSFWEEGKLHLIYDFTVTVGDSVSFDFDDLSSDVFVGPVVQDTQIMVNGFSLRKISCELVSIDSVWGPSDPVMYHYAERIGACCGTEFPTWQTVVPEGPGVITTEPVFSGFLRCYEDDDIYYQTPYFQTLGVPCDHIMPVSIDQPEASGWRVYPNPSQGEVMLSVPPSVATASYQVQIWDVKGRMVWQRQLSSTDPTLSLADLLPGLYLLRISTQGQVVHTQRLQLR
jgi:hypothetical protein